jgi:integrase
VYAGTDPVTRKRHYLVETIPAGRGAEREAEKARSRLLAQADERRNRPTRATLDQLFDRWLDVVELEPPRGSPTGPAGRSSAGRSSERCAWS